jgi:hypothetical protein
LSVRLFKNIYWYLPRKSIFSIIYSEYVNFLICTKHMTEGCSVGISSIKIHHKQQLSAKNTLNYEQKSTYAWTSWVLSCRIHILLCIYTKQTSETVSIKADKADRMDIHWALVCPAICRQECTLISQLKILPHTSEFNRSHKCDWLCYKIFLLRLSEYWLC